MDNDHVKFRLPNVHLKFLMKSFKKKEKKKVEKKVGVEKKKWVL